MSDTSIRKRMRDVRTWRSFFLREASKRKPLVNAIYTGTVSGGALLVVAMTTSNILNYFFHITMGRMLGPSEYGTLSSLNNIFLVIYFAAGVSQVIVSHHAAYFEARQELSSISSLVADSSKTFLIGGVILTLAFLGSTPIIASMLRLSSAVPLVILATAFVPAIQLPVFRGCLQGLQRFKELAGMIIAQPSLRLLLAVILVSLGTRADGAILSMSVAAFITLAIGLVCLHDVFRHRYAREYKASLILNFSIYATVNTVGFTVLTNIDMILVKALFTPEEAGAYAAAAVLGKVILFLPGAIPLVMFPKLSREYALGYSSSHTLRIGLLAVALMCTMPAIVLLLVPRQLVYLVFGLEYEGGISLVGPYAIAMLVYALLNVLVQYYTSISSKLFSIVLIVSMTLQIGLITLFHQDLRQVIFAVAAGGTLALLLGMMLSPLVKMYKVFGA